MRITFVENVRIPSERAHAYQIVQTCAWLSRFGNTVTLVNPARSKEEKDVFDYFGLEKNLFSHQTISAWDPLSSWKGFKYFAYLLQRFSFVRALRTWAAAHETDLWYTRDPAMIDALRGVVSVKWALELHDSPLSNQARWERIKPLVSRFVVISRGLRDHLMELGIPESSICVAPDGYDPTAFQDSIGKTEARKRIGVPENAFVALYAGTFYEWKGVDLAVSAWGKTNADDHLVLIGGPEPDEQRIRSLIPESANARIHILPNMAHAEVLKIFSGADIGLLTSSPAHDIGKKYTSPIKQFEYLRTGLPVLASDVPSSHEILTPDVAMFYEPTEEGFIRAFNAMKQSVAWRESAKNRGPILVEPYTWESRVRKIESCIMEMKSI